MVLTRVVRISPPISQNERRTLYSFSHPIWSERDRERKRQIQTGRQTDRETDWLTDRQTDRQTDQQTETESAIGVGSYDLLKDLREYKDRMFIQLYTTDCLWYTGHSWYLYYTVRWGCLRHDYNIALSYSILTMIQPVLVLSWVRLGCDKCKLFESSVSWSKCRCSCLWAIYTVF